MSLQRKTHRDLFLFRVCRHNSRRSIASASLVRSKRFRPLAAPEEEIFAEDLAKCKIFINDDRVDATSIAYPSYTLQDILSITPVF